MKYFKTAIIISLFFVSCSDKPTLKHQTEKEIKTNKINEEKEILKEDSISKKTHKYQTKILPIINGQVGILIENYNYGDTLNLDSNISWIKEYMESDSLYSIGISGAQFQSFKYALASNPNGDCNRQVVLGLSKHEPKGFMVNNRFLRGDSTACFYHRKEGKSYFVYNKMDEILTDSIFSNEQLDTNSTLSYFISNSKKIAIQKRGYLQSYYNEGLEEEWTFSENESYRIALFKNNNWIVSNWSACPQNSVDVFPELATLSENEVKIIWGFYKGMGDYQMFVSKIEFKNDSITVENSNTLQGYISLGCD